MTRFLNTVWFLSRWGLLLAVLATVVAWPYLSNRIDDEIRRQVLEKFTQHYPTLSVEIASAQLVKGEGIRIRGLTIREPNVEGPKGELTSIDEMFATCPTGLTDLVNGDLVVSRIVVRRLHVRARLLADGTWNAAKLYPLPRFSQRCADALVIENGSCELIDDLADRPRHYNVKDISLSLTPHDGTCDTPACDRTMEVHGTFAADHLLRVEVAGLLAPQGKGWALSGSVAGLNACPELFRCLPASFDDRLKAANSIRGEADASFQIRYALDQQPPLQFQVAGQLTQGRIDDPLLPYPLTDLLVIVRADNSGATLDQLTARHGDTRLHLTGQLAGYSPNSPIVIEGQARRLSLDRRGAETLPENLRVQWKKFEPAGEIDADFKASFDGQKWHPEAHVKCLDVSFSYFKFPYRLERGTGTLDLQNDAATVRMTAFGGGQPLRIEGEFQHPGPDFTGSLEIRGKNLPFDENLFAALPEKSRDAIRALNPQGTFNVETKSWRTDPKEANLHHQMAVHLNRCAMRYDKFAYPLTNISGTLDMVDHRWSFKDLQGSNTTGTVKAQGELVPATEGYEIVMRLEGTDVPLDEQLRDSLKPSLQKLWNDIRPRGSVNLGIDIKYITAKKQFDLKVTGDTIGDSASIEPAFFPYRLEKMKGGFSYRDGHVDFTNVRATHGRVNVAAQGYCDFQPEGEWRLRLNDISVDRLRVDRDVMTALPGKLKKVVGQINPGGPINLRGKMELAGVANRPDVPVTSAWDLEFDMVQGSLDAGIKVENVFGGVRLTGTNDGRHTQCRGELAVDSLIYKDIQVTDILGPLFIDDERILLGGGAEKQVAGKPVRRVTAKAYGGTIAGDCAVALGNIPQYSLRAGMSDGDLARFAKETVPGQKKLNAKVFGNIELSGTSQGVHTLNGKGQLQLREADIYDLPVMVSLLKILSVRPPDKTGFTTSDMDFRVEGDHVYFDKIEFAGDAISLLGKGEMNFESELRMTFHSVVGRSDYQLPVFKSMLGSASEQFMLIHVDGTLAHPHTKTEAFPGVNQALQQLQMDRPYSPDSASRPMGRGTR